MPSSPSTPPPPCPSPTPPPCENASPSKLCKQACTKRIDKFYPVQTLHNKSTFQPNKSDRGKDIFQEIYSDLQATCFFFFQLFDFFAVDFLHFWHIDFPRWVPTQFLPTQCQSWPILSTWQFRQLCPILSTLPNFNLVNFDQFQSRQLWPISISSTLSNCVNWGHTATTGKAQPPFLKHVYHQRLKL